MGNAIVKVEIDLSDMYVEEGEGIDIQSAIKAEIASTVKSEVRNALQAEIKNQVREYVHNELSTEVKAEMRTMLREFLTTKILPTQYGGGEMTAAQYLENLFGQSITKGHLTEEVRDLAKKLGVELKRQYDIAYANKLVQTLNDQGLLLPNVGQLLLDKSAHN